MPMTDIAIEDTSDRQRDSYEGPEAKWSERHRQEDPRVRKES